jgi:hypothetical protein
MLNRERLGVGAINGHQRTLSSFASRRITRLGLRVAAWSVEFQRSANPLQSLMPELLNVHKSPFHEARPFGSSKEHSRGIAIGRQPRENSEGRIRKHRG